MCDFSHCCATQIVGLESQLKNKTQEADKIKGELEAERKNVAILQDKLKSKEEELSQAQIKTANLSDSVIALKNVCPNLFFIAVFTFILICLCFFFHAR
jgi:predicted nuclease with TOPRIM domain